MVHKIVFTVALYATSILAQDQHPAKQISSSGDRMSSIFQWADFVKPRTNRFDTRTGDTDHRLISESAIESRPPDLETGFPSASDVVRPQKRTYPAEASSARKPSVVSGQVLQSQVDKQQRQSSQTGKELQTQIVRQIKQPSLTGKVLLSQNEKPTQPFTSSKIISPVDKQPKQSSASRTEPLSRVYKQPKQPLKSSSSFPKMPTDLPSGDIAPERRGTIDRAPATGIGQGTLRKLSY